MKPTKLQTIMTRIRALWKKAQKDWESVYEWHMGSDVVKELDQGGQLLHSACPEGRDTCYGYPVQTHLDRPGLLELWKKVE